MRARRPYPTDLSDDEWEILKPLIPEAKPVDVLEHTIPESS